MRKGHGMSENHAIELLTMDDEGRAVEGMKVPEDRAPAIIYESRDVDDRRRAYVHKFFRYDGNGQPIPDTLVRFLVPDYMLADGFPTPLACRLVAERMGWDQDSRGSRGGGSQ